MLTKLKMSPSHLEPMLWHLTGYQLHRVITPPEAPPGTPYLAKKIWEAKWEESRKSARDIVERTMALIRKDVQDPVNQVIERQIKVTLRDALKPPNDGKPGDFFALMTSVIENLIDSKYDAY